jgi:5-methylthioadenosine/S-adenosylhomocysteine deaminase
MIAQRYGVNGAFRWLEGLGVLGSTVLAAHSVAVTDPEIGLMAERDVSVAHNPVSNMYLGDGIAPVTRMLAAGVNVALGTDGATSNGSQDMFEVMKTASLLQRLSVGAAAAPRPMQVLRMATINGARAVGLGHVIGSIEVGKRADLIIVDLHHAHDAAINDLPSHLVHSTRSADVETVIVDGRVVMAERTMTGLDDRGLCDQASAAARRLIGRARSDTPSRDLRDASKAP